MKVDIVDATPTMIMPVIQHPRVWPLIKNDLTPHPYDESMLDGFRLYAFMYNGQPVGFAGWKQCTQEFGEIPFLHVAFLPIVRGRAKKHIGLQFLRKVKDIYPHPTFIAAIPEFNTRAHIYLLMMGFKEVGCTPPSYPRGGRLYRVRIFERSKEV